MGMEAREGSESDKERGKDDREAVRLKTIRLLGQRAEKTAISGIGDR
jgi:hypothetical protein